MDYRGFNSSVSVIELLLTNIELVCSGLPRVQWLLGILSRQREANT